MYITVGFCCLVAVAVLGGVTGTSKQDFNSVERNETKSLIDGRGKTCRGIGGRCVHKTKDCPANFSFESDPGRPHCNRGRRCCSTRSGDCHFNGNTYKNTDKTTDTTCAVMKCKNGLWVYSGTTSTNTCGTCKAWGDPHIVPFQLHYLDGKRDLIHYYDTYGIGSFYISVPNIDKTNATFGVYASFSECFGDRSCISRLTYFEGSTSVEMILPTELFTTYCNTANPNDPKCLTEIKVDGKPVTINDDGTVYLNPERNVMVFKESCDFWVCNIFVVGSHGYTVKMNVELRFNYELLIFAMESLKSKLYGLCDVYTGANAFQFTMNDGGAINLPSRLADFIESWNGP